MKHLFLLLLVAFCLMTSCGPVLRIAYGIKSPKPRDEAYLLRFLENKGIDTTHCYSYAFRKWGKTLSNGTVSLPDIVVFDRQGRFIPYSDDGEWICKSNLSPFISLLSDTATYRIDSSRSAGDLLEGLYSLDGKPARFLPDEETDFVVVVLWASFIGGRLAKDNIPEWERQARENPNANIEIVKLSLDPQAWWPESDTLKFESGGKIEFSR